MRAVCAAFGLPQYKNWGIVGFCVLLVQLLGAGPVKAQRIPNIQERRAQQAAQANRQRKEQEIAIFKQRQVEMVARYKATAQERDAAFKQMKISERDYKTALSDFNQAKSKQSEIQAQLGRLKENAATIPVAKLQAQRQQLEKVEAALYAGMKDLQIVQQRSYDLMRRADAEYRRLVTLGEAIKQQMASLQSQLEFVLSQP